MKRCSRDCRRRGQDTNSEGHDCLVGDVRRPRGRQTDLHAVVWLQKLVGECVEGQCFQGEIDGRGVDRDVLSEIEMDVESVGEQSDDGGDLIADATCNLALIEAVATALDGVPGEVVAIGEEIFTDMERGG